MGWVNQLGNLGATIEELLCCGVLFESSGLRFSSIRWFKLYMSSFLKFTAGSESCSNNAFYFPVHPGVSVLLG